MSNEKYNISALGIKPSIDRNSFDCGEDKLNAYIKQQATQDIKNRVANCYIATTDDYKLAGYYTLNNYSLQLGEIPDEHKKKLPKYPMVGCILMGRLAVDKEHQGKKLGSILVADALAKVYESEIPAYALVVDSKNEKSTSFYLHEGFIQLKDAPQKLFIPMASIKHLME